MLPLWAWDHPKFCRQLPARDHHRHHNSPRSMRLVALMEISECPKKCRINGSYLLWFVLVRSISRRVGVSWFMGLGVWIWREAKMKECFDEISHRSGVINLAAYKEASWRTWWCRTKSLWNFPCTYITTYIYIHMYVFLCLHRYKHISYILYMRIYVYIYMYYRNMFFFLTSRRGCMMIQPEEMCWKWRKDHSTVRHSTKSAWTVKHFWKPVAEKFIY